ncbi:MAG: MoaD/ThiS family protein [Desulfurococcaceae archaeon TW002]
MRVYVTFLGRASDLVEGRKVYEVELSEGSTLADLLRVIRDKISRRVGEGILEGRLFLYISVNGVGVLSLNHVLKDGDSVTFLTPEMGG